VIRIRKRRRRNRDKEKFMKKMYFLKAGVSILSFGLLNAFNVLPSTVQESLHREALLKGKALYS
jgi:hypothetical protein